MSGMERFGVTVAWQNATIPALRAVVVEADNLGYGHLWLTEAWGLELLSTVGYLLAQTKRIRLGSAVLNVYSRSAALIGMSCATLDQIAPGRFMLGLGTSGRALIEDWHGVAFGKPLTRTREYVEVIRKVAQGEPADYQGEMVKVKRFRLFTKPMHSALEIYLGAIGEKNLRLAGEVADGAIVTMYPVSRLEGALRLLGGKRMFVWYPLSIVDSKEEEEKARFRNARNIAFYVASMGKYYAQNLSRMGYEEEVEKIISVNAASGSKGAAAVVSDELLEELAFVGSAKAVFEKISERVPESVFPAFGFSVATLEEATDAIRSLRAFASEVGT